VSSAKKTTTLISLLDKQHPPDHSFVTGMLAQALPDNSKVRVQLLVGGDKTSGKEPLRYSRR
jgi:hypothetical protein